MRRWRIAKTNKHWKDYLGIYMDCMKDFSPSSWSTSIEHGQGIFVRTHLNMRYGPVVNPQLGY